jgi:hypothetical protein
VPTELRLAVASTALLLLGCAHAPARIERVVVMNPVEVNARGRGIARSLHLALARAS